MKKRLLSILLAAAMALSLTPAAAYAAVNEPLIESVTDEDGDVGLTGAIALISERAHWMNRLP